MHPLKQIAQDLTYQFFGNELEVGKYFRYSKKGKAKKEGIPIKIIAGTFLDPVYGRLSNYWCWQQVKSDGTLEKEKNKGYGGGREFFYPITEQKAIMLASNHALNLTKTEGDF